MRTVFIFFWVIDLFLIMMNTNCFFKEKIRHHGACPFVDFMNMALYDPQHGYYATKQHILGKQGDFVTAPELSHLFGHTFARQMIPILRELQQQTILEIGAGSGRLCVDILNYLQKHSALPTHYYILELSSGLRQQQQQFLQTHFPQFKDCVVWITEWPTNFSGVVVANEVLDAMPVHRFLWKDEQVLESYVEYCQQTHELKEVFVPTQHLQLEQYVRSLQLASDMQYCSEVNLWAPGWLEGLYHSLNQGVVFLIDYGFPRHEYYHPDRIQGTMMCHEKHQSHPDALYRPGHQDITAHVDFTFVAEVAHDLGFSVMGYTNQASFLLSNGILELLAEEQEKDNYHALAQQVKLLLQSHEMGEIFKVMALSKQFTMPLAGFMMFDKRVSL
jgi:SAM-dependent MidA family methyltransferase